jgi:methionine sulfoxide reductase heme-binding subunit
VSATTHWFWILSRGAGTAALVLAATSISYGLVMAGRMKRGGTSDRRTYHEALALATLVAIVFHGLVLLGDPFLHPNLADVTVPFVSSYKTIWTSMGIVAGWMLVTIGLSFYVRDRIGRARYAIIHRLVIVAWVLGLIHAFFEGTDAGTVWVIGTVVVSSLPPVVLLGLRLTGRTLPERSQARDRTAVAGRATA